MEKRLVLFLLLSAVIFFGWSYIYTKLYPPPVVSQNQEALPSSSPTIAPAPTTTSAPTDQNSGVVNPATVPSTQAEVKQISIKTDNWLATLSNQGGVITDWTMIKFPDGKPIDAPKGVNLVSPQLSQQIGGSFRFYIPSDSELEKTLNGAVFEIRNLSESELFIGNGEKKEISLFLRQQ